MGILNIVGIGPGNDDHITPAALNALKTSDHVIGYTTYIRLIKQHIQGKEITRTGMSEEIGRAKAAIELAKEGKTISLISSGDAGVYGMAGLVFDCLREMNWKRGESPEINFFPGITAANSCGSLVGAPLIHDSCTISLSDLLTPWTVIENRIYAAAKGDFVISFYNPASGRRQRQIVEAQRIIKEFRSGTTPVALIKSAYRKRQEIILTDLDNFLDYEIGMLTTVMIGSSQTYVYEGYMVTPRGYSNKYDMQNGDIKEGQRKTFSLRHEGDMKDRLVDIKKNEGEQIKLAKTYVTPTESWVTPKDIHNTDILNEELETPVTSALKAIDLLKNTGILTSNKPLPKKEVRELKTLEEYSTLSLLEGALLFFDGKKYFQIGDFKNPCDLADFGFEVLEVYDNNVFFKELKKLEGTFKKTTSLFLIQGKDVDGVNSIYHRFAIKRNHSISKRIIRLIEEKSQIVLYKNEEITDARWLSSMPLDIWEMIRTEILKC